MLKHQRAHVAHQREHTEFMFGQLTSWVVNTASRTTTKPVDPQDFMPSAWSKKASGKGPKTKLIRMTKKRRAAVAASLSAHFPLL